MRSLFSIAYIVFFRHFHHKFKKAASTSLKKNFFFLLLRFFFLKRPPAAASSAFTEPAVSYPLLYMHFLSRCRRPSRCRLSFVVFFRVVYRLFFLFFLKKQFYELIANVFLFFIPFLGSPLPYNTQFAVESRKPSSNSPSRCRFCRRARLQPSAVCRFPGGPMRSSIFFSYFIHLYVCLVFNVRFFKAKVLIFVSFFNFSRAGFAVRLPFSNFNAVKRSSNAACRGPLGPWSYIHPFNVYFAQKSLNY